IVLAQQGVPPAGPLAMLANDPETRGPELYDKHCGVCHKLNERGPEAGKETAPNLTGFGTAAWAKAVLDNPDSDKLFGHTSFKGMMESVTRKPADPAAAEYFTAMKKADIDAISAFLADQAQGGKGAHAAGEKLVKQRCTGCHRLDGNTDNEESLAPELRGWGSKSWIAQQIANPGGGKTYPQAAMGKDVEGHMPAFEEQLSAAEIKLLTTWVWQQTSGAGAKPAATEK
ncbi:MAG TPA: c-type cytochrome, partial [Sorangium sp.]|nr:c-type cytochrome [Sorangium sp.]